MSVFFTSDLHIGHLNAIAFDNRPFSSVEEMESELIRRWNNKVKPGDTVYVLGDMIWRKSNRKALDLLNTLNGNIVLVRGNHDFWYSLPKIKQKLVDIVDKADICVTLKDGTKVRAVLSHYFEPFYLGQRYNGVHLYGHFHNSKEHYDALDVIKLLQSKGYDIRAYNVGCMHWDYEPVTLDEILERGYNYPTRPIPNFEFTDEEIEEIVQQQ